MFFYNPPPCHEGLKELQKQNVHAEVDRDLKISFNDPVGLSPDLCKLQNRTAYQGTCEFGGVANTPTLYVDGKSMGTLLGLKTQELKALAQPSQLHDENAGKVMEIKGSRINLQFWCPDGIQRMAPAECNLVAKLEKLMIYGGDGLFAEHANTQHRDNYIGTLVWCLPVPYEGGALILSDEGNELRLPFDEMVQDDKIPWAAFYADVKHQVEVKSGMRMTLQFDLIAERIPHEDNPLSKILQGSNGGKCNSRALMPTTYRFQGFNPEILNSIRNKLSIVLPREERKTIPSPMQKRDRPDDDEPLKATSTKQIKTTALDCSEIIDFDDDDDDSELKNEEFANPDCVAILLKRKYKDTTLSLDTLRGSDKALYHALKDHFRVEVKKIILEQYVNCDERHLDRSMNFPIKAVALSECKKKDIVDSDSCSSEDECKLGAKIKFLPKKTQAGPKKPKKAQETEITWRNAYTKSAKKACLVLGFPPKSVSTLVEQRYIPDGEIDGQPGIYSYIHTALFVYPK